MTLEPLPDDPPVLVDDGGFDSDYRTRLPSTVLPAATGGKVHVFTARSSWAVIFGNPMTARPRQVARIRRSLLDVGLPVCGWRTGSTGESGDHEDRCQERRHRQELGRDWCLENAQLLLEGVGESE